MTRHIKEKMIWGVVFSLCCLPAGAANSVALNKDNYAMVRPVDMTPLIRQEVADKITKQHHFIPNKKTVSALRKDTNRNTLSLTLSQAVRLALANNRDVKVAYYTLKQSDCAIAEAKSGKMPKIEYNFSAGRTGEHNGMNMFGHTLSLSLPVYTGNRLENAVTLANIEKMDAQEGVLKTEQEIKLNAIKGYFKVLAAQEVQQVYQEAVENLQAHVKNVKAQYTAGTVAKLDVLNTEVSLAAAETKNVSALNDVALASDQLSNIVGVPLQTALVLQDHTLPFPAYSRSLDESVQYAMKYRPEVLQAALAVQKANVYVDLMKGDTRPQAGIRLSQEWKDTSFPGTAHSSWRVGGEISYSLFDGGIARAKMAKAKQDFFKANEMDQKVRESVTLQVKQAYLAISSAKKRVDAAKAAITQAKEGFKISQVRYQAGVGINLDVLDAQLALNQAKINYIQALYDYNVGIAMLEQAMGIDAYSGVIRP